MSLEDELAKLIASLERLMAGGEPPPSPPASPIQSDIPDPECGHDTCVFIVRVANRLILSDQDFSSFADRYEITRRDEFVCAINTLIRFHVGARNANKQVWAQATGTTCLIALLTGAELNKRGVIP